MYTTVNTGHYCGRQHQFYDYYTSQLPAGVYLVTSATGGVDIWYSRRQATCCVSTGIVCGCGASR